MINDSPEILDWDHIKDATKWPNGKHATDSVRSFKMVNIAYFYPLQTKSNFLTSQ